MATIHGAIRGITIVNSSAGLGLVGAEKTALLTVDFDAYTGASDSADIEDVGAKIAASMRNGKSVALRAAHCCAPGVDTNGQLIYTGAITVSSDDLTFDLTAVDRTTEIITSTAATGVGVLVTFTES